MDAINKNHWRSLKKFVTTTLKKAESHHIDEDDQNSASDCSGLDEGNGRPSEGMRLFSL